MTAARGIKRFVKSVLSTPLGSRAAGALLRKPGVTVLMYHRVGNGDGLFPALDTALFAEHMRWLSANGTPIGPEDLRRCARNPRRLRPAILVTFDDGYRDYHDNAYPVLKDLGIPAVVFLATSFMDHGGLLWTDQVELAAHRTAVGKVELPWAGGQTWDLSGEKNKAAFIGACKNHLKRLPDEEMRAALLGLLAALGASEATLDVPRQMLTWDEVRATMDLTTYGGHSHTHPILSRLDPTRLEEEIGTCRDRIASETRAAPTLFAYPNGRREDFTSETKAVLQRHGFEMAFATTEGLCGPDTDWMEIKRIPGDGTIPEFAWLVAGLARS